MAFSKEHKAEMLEQYEKWVQQSEAIFLLEFNKMRMKDIDTLRSKMREAGGRLHVSKNTLMKMALNKAGIESGDLMEGSTLCGFVEKDAPAVAKALSDAIKGSEVFKVKGGFLDGKKLSGADVKALAELPPLPVMRAQLLGVLNAPASKLVRTLAEPARGLAAVIKAHADQQTTAA